MAKTVKLYEDQGETSRYIEAEINGDGRLKIMAQDVGKAVQEFWGDIDYEFMVSVVARHKDAVYRALLEKLQADNSKAAEDFGESTDDSILALMKKLYAGDPAAVDEFQSYMRSKGIPVEFNSWI